MPNNITIERTGKNSFANLARPKLNAMVNAITTAMTELRRQEVAAKARGDAQTASTLMTKRHDLSDYLFEVQRARDAAPMTVGDFNDRLKRLEGAVGQAQGAVKSIKDAKAALDAAAVLIKLLAALVGIFT